MCPSLRNHRYPCRAVVLACSSSSSTTALQTTMISQQQQPSTSPHHKPLHHRHVHQPPRATGFCGSCCLAGGVVMAVVVVAGDVWWCGGVAPSVRYSSGATIEEPPYSVFFKYWHHTYRTHTSSHTKNVRWYRVMINDSNNNKQQRPLEAIATTISSSSGHSDDIYINTALEDAHFSALYREHSLIALVDLNA